MEKINDYMGRPSILQANFNVKGTELKNLQFSVSGNHKYQGPDYYYVFVRPSKEV